MIGTTSNQIAALSTTTSNDGVPPDPATVAAAELRFQGLKSIGSTGAALSPAPTTRIDPLAGFTVRATDSDRRTLSAALQRIGSSAIGSELLASVRDRGIGMQALDDAAFDLSTHGAATDAVAVFISGGSDGPQLLVRASALSATAGDVDAPEHIIAHELTHAAQYIAGEGAATYRASAAVRGAQLGADQVRAGATLMAESGAELLATGMMAQLQSPERFNAVAAARVEESATDNWNGAAGAAAYNPNGYELPRFVSPEATRILRAGLPTSPTG